MEKRFTVTKTWMVDSGDVQSTHLDWLLDNGWEPFAVTTSPGSEGIVWLRKEKYVTKEGKDGEKA